jgi:hypothetical protein
MPGVTVIETGVNDGGEQAPGESTYVSETAGMSESQAAALRFVDQHRAAAMNGSDAIIQRQVNKALDHAFRNGPAPDFIAARDQARTDAAANDRRPVSESTDDIQVGAEFDPMSTAEAERIRHNAVLSGVTPADAATFAEFAVAAELPKIHADIIGKRLAHHASNGDGNLTLTESEHQDFYNEAARSFGSVEKLHEVNARARAYIESIPGLANQVDTKFANSSVLYDPRVLLSLAHLADVKGLKVK